jgi:hypothetical protein
MSAAEPPALLAVKIPAAFSPQRGIRPLALGRHVAAQRVGTGGVGPTRGLAPNTLSKRAP